MNTDEKPNPNEWLQLITLCALPLIAIFIIVMSLIVDRHINPARCMVNIHTKDTPIETRNYTPTQSWSEQEPGQCFNPTTNTYEWCQKTVDHYEPATFEWRYIGTEQWAKETKEPAGTGNEHPYRRVTEYDVQICDQRPEHANKNGQVESRHITTSYYI